MEKNEEITKQFEKILDEAKDPIVIQRKQLKKKREEIQKDKDYYD